MSDEELIGENAGRVSRPTLAQVKAVVEYMEKHPDLSHKSMRVGVGHAKFKKMWVEMSNIANSLGGAIKSTKGWIKFWADKRRSILMKQKQIQEGKTQCSLSPLEQKILNLCGDKAFAPRKRKAVKQEPCNGDDDTSYDDMYMGNDDFNHLEHKSFPNESDQRQLDIMEKLVDVMDQQASAMSQMAQASLGHSKAMERIAEASNAQALAVDRLAGAFESISASVLDVRNAILGIDYTMKRCFPISTAQTRQNANNIF